MGLPAGARSGWFETLSSDAAPNQLSAPWFLTWWCGRLAQRRTGVFNKTASASLGVPRRLLAACLGGEGFFVVEHPRVRQNPIRPQSLKLVTSS